MKPLSEFTDGEFAMEAGRTRHASRKERKATTAKIQSFATIEAEPIEWLWPGRIAIGKASLYVGDPGMGKSQGSLDLAARTSTGIAFPDSEQVPEIGDTLILTSEDDPGDTIRPRLDALGADVKRIFFLHCKVEGNGQQEIPSIADVDVFRNSADQIRAGGGSLRLLIIDPIEGFLAGADAHRNAEVRAVLAPLIALASRERFAILGIQHLNKGNGSAAYRVGGSIAFTALARAVWVFCRDPENEGRRLFLCLKNNLGVDQSGLEYRIASAENGSPFISWQGPADDDVRTVLSHDRPKQEKEKVSPEQDRVMELMHSKSPAAVQRKDIAEHLGKSPTAVGKILDKLQDQGLVKRAVTYGYWQLCPQPDTRNTGHSGHTGDSAPAESMQQSPQCLLCPDDHDIQGRHSRENQPSGIPDPLQTDNGAGRLNLPLNPGDVDGDSIVPHECGVPLSPEAFPNPLLHLDANGDIPLY